MPAPKANFANVFINDTLWGLYTNVEAINRDFVSTNFGQRKKPFIKCDPDNLDINICGDFSSASFFILAALICPKSELLIKNVGINKTRIGLLHALRHMGANIKLLNQNKSHH